MADLLRAQELKLREESGDASAAVVPTLYLRTEHPFRIGDRERDRTGDFYYWFPRECLWAPAAQGFGQLRGAVIANSTACYQSLIDMVFVVAKRIGDGMENEMQKQFVTWTVVPRANDEKTYAGFLLRCTYQIDLNEVHKTISDHLTTCDAIVAKAQEKGQSVMVNSSLARHLRFTHDSYVTMCDYYMGRSVGDRSRGFQDLSDPLNPYNPEILFSLKTVLAQMRYAGAAPDFCLAKNYVDETQSSLFPRNGACTWLLSPSQLSVTDLRKIYMPHAPRNRVDTSNPEFVHYARNAAGVAVNSPDFDGPAAAAPDGYDSEAEMPELQNLSKEELVDRLQQDFMKVAPHTDGDASNSLATYKKRVKKRMTAVGKPTPATKREWARKRHAAQLECTEWLLSEVITTDATADVGETLKGVAKWYNEHLERFDNFMMPEKKYSSNLSRFADFQLGENIKSETVWAINTAHAEIRSLRLACMHVYYYSPFHSHTCLFGPPGAGKSNAFQVNAQLMIEGTTRDIGCESAKAKMTPGKKTDLAVETYEDIPPSQLGVSNFMGGGNRSSSTSATSNTDAESLLKYRLTKGRVKGVYKSVVNGVHSMVEVDSFCNTVMLIGMNALLSQVPKSISDRFNNIQFQHRNRVDASGTEQSMTLKHQLACDPQIDVLKQGAILRAHRNQCFHAIIQLLCWAGVFEKPDLSVPVLIWSQTLNLAQQKGLQDTSNVRHFERLRFHCETLIVEDAIDRVLDSEVSPLDINEKFKLEDILHFEKHLYGTTEHASMALGLLQHQWENPVISAVEKFFRFHMFKAKYDAGDIGKPDPIPEAQQEMSYYYVTRFETSLQSNVSTYDREKSMQQTELLRRLAMYAHKRMNPKPSLDEVIYALECLSTLQIDVESNAKAGEKVRIPALAFSRDGDAMVAVHMMKHYVNDRMKSCLKEVLCHEHTKKKNILYGRVKDDTPYMWQSMCILPKKGKILTMENPNYFSSAVRQLLQRSLEGVTAGLKPGAAGDGGIDPSDFDDDAFNATFSKTSHKVVDMDLDEHAAQLQADKIGLRYLDETSDAPNYNTSPHSITKAVKDALSDERLAQLALYPRCFTELNKSQTRMDRLAHKRLHPADWSMSGDLKRRRMADEGVADDDGDESKSNGESNGADGDHDVEMHEIDDDEMCSDGDVDGDDGDDGDDVEPAALGPRGPFGASMLQRPPPQQQPNPYVYSAFASVPHLPAGDFNAQMSRIASLG